MRVPPGPVTLMIVWLGSMSAFAERPVAAWPPVRRPVPVILDADAANEVDDQYAIALALGYPDRIDLRGFVAAHFWGQRRQPGNRSIIR